MDIIKQTPVNFAMQAGVVIGLVGFVRFFMQSYSFDYPFIAFLYLLILVVYHVLVFFQVRKFKLTVFDGSISFFQAWNVSLLIYFFASLITGSLEFGYTKFINPEHNAQFIEKVVQATTQLIAQLNETSFKETVSLSLKAWQEMPVPTPIQAVFDHIQSSLLGGIFMSIIIASIVQKNKIKPQNETSNNNETV